MKKRKLFNTLKISTLVVSLCSSIYLVGASLAWYVQNTTLTITSKDNINIRGGLGVEIALCDGWDFEGEDKVYGNSIEVNKQEEVSEKSIPDITGDGMTFYFPRTLNANEQVSDPETLLPVDYYQVGINEYILVYNIAIRTAETIDIYLGAKSVVSPRAEADKRSGKNCERQCSGGAGFTKDYIAGCARMSFIEQVRVENEETGEVTFEPHLKAVWAPNPEYQFTKVYDNNSAKYIYSYTEKGVREDTYKYLGLEVDPVTGAKTVTEYVYTTQDYGNGNIMVGTNMLCSTSSGGSDFDNTHGQNPLLSFNQETLNEKYLTILVWFEGTDRESNYILSGGLIDFSVELVGISKLAQEAPVLFYSRSLNKFVIDSDGEGNYVVPGNLEYSTDGFTWAAYSSRVVTSERDAEKYVFRAVENDVYRYSDVVVISGYVN